MANSDIQSLLRTGIQAARDGNKTKARRIFERVLKMDDSNELAWLWMASVVSTLEERRVCLENVLDINPNNERAVKALARLKARQIGQARTRKKPKQPPEPKREEKPKPSSRITRVSAAASQRSQPQLSKPASSSPAWDSASLFDTSPPAAQDKPSSGTGVQGSRPNRTLILLLGGLGVVAVIVIAVVLAAQVSDTSDGLPPQTAVPTSPPTRVVLVDPSELEFTPVPTWTPQPTVTPYPSRTPTATPPPFSFYTLIFSGRQSGRPSNDIYRLRADGAEDELFQITTDSGDEMDPAVSPDGSDVVFVSSQSGNPELYLMRTDGKQTGPAQLTETGAEELESPAWSPDGQHIVFSAKMEGELDSEIYIVPLDSPRDLIQITDNQETDREPAWSPDGKTIVFSSDRVSRGYLQIFSVPANCGEEGQFGRCEEKTIQLTSSQHSSMSPAWSPDGRYIVFVSNRKSLEDEDIYRMLADGTDARPLTLEEYGDNRATDRDPVWSPDGRWIAFASDREARRFQIFIMSTDGSLVVQVTSFLGGAISPSWLPN